MNIIFTGTQNTGKTTLINEIESKIDNVVKHTEMVRKLSVNDNIYINRNGDDYSQRIIGLHQLMDITKSDNSFINLFDRSNIDNVVYGEYLFQNNKITKSTNEYCYSMLDMMINYIDIDVIIYIKQSLEIVEDGIRDTNINFINELELIFDVNIRKIQTKHNIPIIIIDYKDMDMRVNKILNFIGRSK